MASEFGNSDGKLEREENKLKKFMEGLKDESPSDAVLEEDGPRKFIDFLKPYRIRLTINLLSDALIFDVRSYSEDEWPKRDVGHSRQGSRSGKFAPSFENAELVWGNQKWSMEEVFKFVKRILYEAIEKRSMEIAADVEPQTLQYWSKPGLPQVAGKMVGSDQNGTSLRSSFDENKGC